MFEDESPEEKLLSAIRGEQGASRTKGVARLRSVVLALCARAVAAADRIVVAVAVLILIGSCGSVVRAVRLGSLPVSKKQDIESTVEPSVSMSLEAYQKGVRGQDLFGVAPAASEGPSVNADLAGLQLQGVITAEPRQAILKETKNDTTIFVAVGDRVGGYTVKTIEDGKVTLINGEDRFELKM